LNFSTERIKLLRANFHPFFICFQWTFCISCAVVLGACAWFYFQTVSGRDAVYAAAFIMGCGNSVMLVTVLSMTADMIGIDKVGQTMHLAYCRELLVFPLEVWGRWSYFNTAFMVH